MRTSLDCCIAVSRGWNERLTIRTLDKSLRSETRQEFRHGNDEQAAERLHGFRYRASRRPDRVGSHSLPVMLLLIALAILAGILAYRAFLTRFDTGLRSAVSEHLAELFPEASIFVGRVTADGPGTLVVNDIRMAVRGDSTRREVLAAERAVLRGDLDISHWLQQQVAVHEVHLHGLQIDAWPLDEERWSLQALKPHPQPHARPPKIVLHDSIIRVQSRSGSDESALAIHDINGHIQSQTHAGPLPTPNGMEALRQLRDTLRESPADGVRQGTRRSSERSASNRGNELTEGSSPGANPQPIFELHLTGNSGGLARRIQIDAEFDSGTQATRVTGSVEALHVSPKLVRQLPASLEKDLSQVDALDCMTTGTFTFQTKSSGPPEFRVQGHLSSGRLVDSRLPYPLENLGGDYFCRNGLLQLRNLQANSGRAHLSLNADVEGFQTGSPLVLHVDARQLELDQQLYDALPENYQQVWERLQLAGRLSGRLQLEYDGTDWTPSAEVECHDVEMTPWLFPYRMTSINGGVQLEDTTLSSEGLVGRAGGKQINGDFRLTRIGTEWYGQMNCNTSGPVPVDEQLLSALTPVGQSTSEAESFVRTLQPSGSLELVAANFHRAPPSPISREASENTLYLADDFIDNSPWRRRIDANVYDATIRYQHFAYPIYNIRGRIVGEDDAWTIDRFEGRNDSGRILCSGSWENVETGETPFELNFEAFTLPLEEELKSALPSDAQFIWDELQPSGSIDSVSATIARHASDEEVMTRVSLVEERRSNHVTGRSLRLYPRSFPYWLTDVDCRIQYRPGFVTIERASAVHAATRMALTGECHPTEDGRWRADVRWLPTTRLIVDSQLIKALPESVRQSLLKLDFSGPLSLLGQSQITFANSDQSKPETNWDCQLDIEDGKLADGKNIGALRGTLWVKGYSDGEYVNASGQIGMDALTVQQIPVTNLRGPFALMGSKLYFGSRVSEVLPQAQPSESDAMTAEALAGQLTISGMSRLETGKFYLDAELHDAELNTLLQEVGVHRGDTQAQCHASLEFNGIPWNPQTYDGRGEIRLRDARIYQLPFMMRLMRTASVNAKDDSAFQRADINFEIDGDRIPLQVACDGDVLRLRGEGWTNLRREIDLELYSYVGRRIPISRVVSPLLAESRYATFMMIEVNGTLDNPSMQRRPFPQLEATLQQIFPEIEELR